MSDFERNWLAVSTPPIKLGVIGHGFQTRILIISSLALLPLNDDGAVVILKDVKCLSPC